MRPGLARVLVAIAGPWASPARLERTTFDPPELERAPTPAPAPLEPARARRTAYQEERRKRNREQRRARRRARR